MFWGVTRYLYLQSFYLYTITVKHYSQYDCLYGSHDYCLFICLLELLATCLLLLERNAYTYSYTYSQAMVRRDVRAPSNSTSVEENESFILFYLLSIRLHYNLCLYFLDIRIDTFTYYIYTNMW